MDMKNVKCKEKEIAFAKVVKVIESCKKREHLPAASRMVNNFERLYGTSNQLVDVFYTRTQLIL